MSKHRRPVKTEDLWSRRCLNSDGTSCVTTTVLPVWVDMSKSLFPTSAGGRGKMGSYHRNDPV